MANQVSIGNLSKMLNVETHSIRYWVDSFEHLKALVLVKNNHRYFTEKAIEEIKKIKELRDNYQMSMKGIQECVRYGKIHLPQQNNAKNSNKAILIKEIENILHNMKNKIALCIM
jgi:DNA-binding transcriptional MerR regulator